MVVFLLEVGLDLGSREPVLAIGPADRIAHRRQGPVVRRVLRPLRITDHRRRHEIVHRDSFLLEEIIQLDVVAVLGGAADPLAVADDEIAQLALGIEFVEEAIGIARPRDELVFHLDASLGGEVLAELHQGVGGIPGRPTQGQLFGLGGSLSAEKRSDSNRARSQRMHHSDHLTLPVVAGDRPPALSFTLRRARRSVRSSQKPRKNCCLVLLLSERFSLNTTAVNGRHGFPP